LRGALALALVLGLPPDMPRREDIVTIAFAVVAFSVFVQGLTMSPLLRRLGQLDIRPRGTTQ
jgi:CPA1 family monovalent cation:H+ antiporter